ncbi:hypothetical protein AN958_11974 [Leucoagaricus sp. SymC.cos]|nr:hypothetical protein AN958_11974 [Leucoagaricus sp. SymC.cos]
MAEEDNEVLDWGNEDDVVSLGDEDERDTPEDTALATQNGSTDVLSAQNASAAPSRVLSVAPSADDPPTKTPDRQSAASAPEPSKSTPTGTTPNTHKIAFPTRLTHALPAKPMTSNIPYVPPSDPMIVEATAMALRPQKGDIIGHEVRDGGRYDDQGLLPSHWEVRFSRDKPNTYYYYDLRNDVATWQRPTTSSSSNTAEAPVPLSHGDRHYRPDQGRHSSGSGRRHESSNATDSRHTRHHSNTAGRSPTRGRDRSRTPSPHGRDFRARGSQRSARGRGNKSNAPQRESSTTDAPRDEDRHWAPSSSSTSNHMSKSARRQQNRAQNHPTDVRVPEPRPEEAVRVLLQREPSGRGHNRERERPLTPEQPRSNTISTRPITPPPQEEPVVIYQTKTQPRREISSSLARSPGPAIDPAPPPPTSRRDRPSRFGPGPTTIAPERANGLPVKPVTTHVDRPDESTRASDRRHERRMEHDRDFVDTPPRYEPPPYRRSPVQTQEPERFLAAPSNGDRDRDSPVRSENSGSAPSRKRQPLPPQDAEFRGIGKSKPAHSDAPNQRHRNTIRSPPFTVQGREKAVDLPPPPHLAHRTYSGWDEPRDTGYNPSLSGPRDVHVEHGPNRERQKGGQRMNDQDDTGRRNYDDMVMDPPSATNNRPMYPERERDPPSKPRAMQVDTRPTSPAFSPTAPSSSIPTHPSRYHDRPSPPHLSTSDSRRETGARPGPPASLSWQERKEERRDDRTHAPPLEKKPARGPRGGPAPVSSSNSIPIGTRRSFAAIESVVTDYPSANHEHYGAPYPPNDVPRQSRNHDSEYARSYPQQEPVPEPRSGYAKVCQWFTFPEVQQENNTRQQGQGRFGGHRNVRSRFDQELSPLDPTPPQQKTWSPDYDTSSRGRFSNNSARDVTPPPVSQEASYTSPQWDPPPTSNFQEPPTRTADYRGADGYHELPSQATRMDVDPPPHRQVLVVPAPYNAPEPVNERYRRQNAEFEGHARPPPTNVMPPRLNSRRDPASYSPEARRAPNLPQDGIDRGVGGRQTWDPTSLSGLSVDNSPQNERPRMLNERISGHHPLPMNPELRTGRKQHQGSRQDNGYNGEPDTFGARAQGRMDIRQDNQAHLPPNPKTFEQRLESVDRPPIPRGGSLLSRISHGGNDVPPPPPSLRDRVQVGNKRDREDMVGDHFPKASADMDDGDLDAGSRRRKRRRARRGGGPA